MSWTRIKQNYGMGMVEQWILRECDAPICSLRRGEEAGTWLASLLQTTGISAAQLAVHGAATLEQAQAECERELRRMGWKWGAAHPAPFNKTKAGRERREERRFVRGEE